MRTTTDRQLTLGKNMTQVMKVNRNDEEMIDPGQEHDASNEGGDDEETIDPGQEDDAGEEADITINPDDQSEEEASEELLSLVTGEEDFAALLRRTQRTRKDVFRDSGKFHSYAKSPGSILKTPGDRRKQSSPRKRRLQDDTQDFFGDDSPHHSQVFASTPATSHPPPQPAISDDVFERNYLDTSDECSKESFVFGSKETECVEAVVPPAGGSQLYALFDEDEAHDSGLGALTQ